jgi:hypothetical protein
VGSEADQERLEEERRREALKMNFEHLKHLTTLGTATAVVELTVYQAMEGDLDIVTLLVSLITLAVCVAGSLAGMVLATYLMRVGGGGPGMGPSYFSAFGTPYTNTPTLTVSLVR